MSPKLTTMCALLAFSALLGTFANIVFAPHVHRQYHPDWSRAAWIGTSHARSAAYFRKELFLASLPTKAHIQIAAPDSFDLYVNRTRILGRAGNTKILVSASASAIFDLSAFLEAGKNVLAVQVNLQTRPAQPQLIAHGWWQDQSGELHPIVSDGSWRVSAKEEWQAARTVGWFDPAFIDKAWPFAAEVEPPMDRPMQQLDLPPVLFQHLPRGQWVWNEDRAVQKAAFRRTFKLQGKEIVEAWIGVSSDAAYALAINDMLLTAATSGPSMQTYDIGRYLHWGENTVAIAAAALPPPRAPRLIVALMTNIDGNWHDFSSDNQWLSMPEHEAGSEWAPAAIAGPMGRVPLTAEAAASSPVQLGYPPLQIMEVPPPLGWWLKTAAKAAAWSGLLLLANLTLIWLIARALCRKAASIEVACSAWIHAGVAGSLLLCFLFLLQFDVRVPQPTVFQPAVFFAVWLVPMAWAAFTLVASRANAARKAVNG